MGKNYVLRELSAREALEAFQEAETLFEQSQSREYDKMLWRGMCEYAAVLCYALCDETGRVFSAAEEVLEELSMRQLAFWGERYETCFLEGDIFSEEGGKTVCLK